MGILIVSTTAAETPSSDSTYSLLENIIYEANTALTSTKWDIYPRKIVTDDVEAIKAAITHWTDSPSTSQRPNLILTSGGTGFSQTDSTPEVGQIEYPRVIDIAG